MLIFLFKNSCQLINQRGEVYIYLYIYIDIYIASLPGGVLCTFARVFSGLKHL